MTKIRTVSQSNAIGQSKLNYSNTRLDFLPVNLIFSLKHAEITMFTDLETQSRELQQVTDAGVLIF